MKKLFAVLVLALLVMSAVPVFAQETEVSADSETSVENSDETKVESETEVRTETTSEETKEETEVKDGERRTRLREEMKDGAGERLNLEIRERVRDISAKDFEAIRAHHEAKLRIALERCSENSECKVDLEKRLALVARLSDKDAERLKRHLDSSEEVREEIESLKKHRELKEFDEEGKARHLAAARLREAKAKHERLEKEFDEAKERIKDARDRLRDASDEEKVEHGKEYLSHVLDAVEDHLNKILAKLDESEHLTEEQVAEIKADVNVRLKAAADLRVRAEAATTRDELKDLASEAKDLVKDVKEHTKKASGRILTHRFGGIIVQSKHLAEKLEKTLARMAEHGLDTSKAEPLVDEFHSLIDSAQKNFEDALAKFKADETEAARESMEKAKNDLKEARNTLREITKEIKAQGRDAAESLEEETEEDEIEVEIEDGIAKVEVEVGDIEMEFELETTNEDDIIAEIVARTGLSEERVRGIVEFEFEDESEEESEEDEE